MPYLIVESSYDPPVTDEELIALYERMTPCLEVRGIKKLRTWVANDRTRMVCEYRAADAESVREAYRAGSVAYLRVWSATLFEPGDFPDAG
jgi:hypothetical protein